jgi:hypothetical protein
MFLGSHYCFSVFKYIIGIFLMHFSISPHKKADGGQEWKEFITEEQTYR